MIDLKVKIDKQGKPNVIAQSPVKKVEKIELPNPMVRKQSDLYDTLNQSTIDDYL